MNLCKTCKHWRVIEAGWTSTPRHDIGDCGRVLLFWDATEWREESDFRELKPENANDLAFVQDGSDYMASLLTRPEFGCIQHEPVEQDAEVRQ